MPAALTARRIETIKPGKERREIPDGYLPGLYLVLHPSGHRSWCVRYRHLRRPRKMTIGGYPLFDLKAAREAGAKALRAVAEGRDPGREKTQRPARSDDLASVAEQFLQLHCARNNRPKTAATTEGLLRRHVLPRWRNRSISEITRRDVLDLLDQIIAAGAPVGANRAFSVVRKFFNWCVARDLLPASPCAGVLLPTAERPRDRVLSDDELRDVWQAAGEIGGPFAALIKLLILTGQRRTEVAQMEWSEIDLSARLWRLPPERVKTGEPHDVPLSEPAVAILAALPRIGDQFTLTHRGTSPATAYAEGKARLNALLPAGMPAWTLHDLRRTVATGMARLGVSLPVTEKVLNHRSGSFAGIVGVYQRHNYSDEKRHALERWGAHVADLVSGGRSQNVVRLETRA